MCGPVITEFGTEEQKKRFLPRMANLDDWWCQGFSEPGAGSDLAGLKTRAVKEGDHYVVNGQKTWTTLAQHADWIFLLVRTDPTAKKQEGISFLLVDMKTPGITVRPIITIEGGHEVNEVFFDDVKVPVENLVGEENRGWDCAKFLLGNERFGQARVGARRERIRRLKAIASTESMDGGAAADARTPNSARKVTEIEVELKALEMTVMRVIATEASARTRSPIPRPRVLKIKGTEIQQMCSELLMKAAGPYAWVDGDPDEPRAATTSTWRPTGPSASPASISTGASSRSTVGRTRSSGTSWPKRSWGSETHGLRPDGRAAPPPGQRGAAARRQIRLRAAQGAIMKSPEGWSREIWAQYAELGLLGLPFAEDEGGFGGGAVETMLVAEQLGKRHRAGALASTVVIGGGFLRNGASAELRGELVPKIAAGELMLAFAQAERQSRYDLYDVATTAKKDGSGWVISGRKGMVMHGDSAGKLVVTARTAGGQRDHKGIGVFLVDAERPRRDPPRLPHVDGQRAAEVEFANARAEAVLGNPEDGLPLVDQVVDETIAALAAEAVGCMQVAHDMTIDYMKTRKQFGRPIGSFQALQHRAADMLVAAGAGALHVLLRRHGRRGARPGRAAQGDGRGQGADRPLRPLRRAAVDPAAWRHRHDDGICLRPLLQAADGERCHVRRCGLLCALPGE